MPVFSSLLLQYEELQVGSRFRDERRRRGLTLRDVARTSAISAARLSQIENGLRTPSLDQAAAIAAALGVPLGAFFPPDRSIPYQVVRDVDVRSQPPRRAMLARPDGGHKDHHNRFWPLADQFVGRQMEPLLGLVVPVPTNRATFCRHHEFEFVSVLNGTVEFAIQAPGGRQREELHAGDCVFFQSSLAHCLRSLEREPADTLHVLSSASTAAETAWDWFSPSAAAFLDRPGDDSIQAIAAELRLLRSARRLGIDDVAALVGVSAHRLEQFERGRRSIPLDTIIRLARLFGRPLQSLLGADAGDRPCYVVQRGTEIARMPPRARRASGTGPRPLHTFYPLAHDLRNSRMYPYLVRTQNASPQPASLHEHHGQEFFYVLNGELDLTITVEDATVQHVLRAGDACYLDCSVPHALTGRRRNPYSSASAEVITIFWCPLGERYLFEGMASSGG